MPGREESRPYAASCSGSGSGDTGVAPTLITSLEHLDGNLLQLINGALNLAGKECIHKN